mmetsp:Transcript_108670/g.151916  ORF Transcript_108670/g.151916 Transcript_108670/m.151916 type:complete len:245 (+) Transcript_108670:483-1217(+)
MGLGLAGLGLLLRSEGLGLAGLGLGLCSTGLGLTGLGVGLGLKSSGLGSLGLSLGGKCLLLAPLGLSLARLSLYQSLASLRSTGLGSLEVLLDLLQTALGLLNLLLVVSLGSMDELVPVGLVLEAAQKVVSEGNGLGAVLLTQGLGGAELSAHGTHGKRLIEGLQETVGVQLIEASAELVVLRVEVVALGNVGPHLLSMRLKLLPESVEEPDSLLLVGASAEVLELLVVGGSREHLQVLARHIE